MRYRLRTAALQDRARIIELIERSARGLGAENYTAQQIEAALRGTFGFDTQLVEDGTYFVVETEGRIVAAGGWSRRRTLFGGDTHAERDPSQLDPRTDAARIRAFFVDPDHARKGLGKIILDHCEAEARARGFSRFELMATLTGARFYAAHGYLPEAPVKLALGAEVSMEFVPMRKPAS